MIKHGRGRIVNNASIAGEIGHPDIWYGISKAGILTITKSFQNYWGQRELLLMLFQQALLKQIRSRPFLI
jgi:3-oxoacyl-[acyl-carrier protein] reductase